MTEIQILFISDVRYCLMLKYSVGVNDVCLKLTNEFFDHIVSLQVNWMKTKKHERIM